MAGLGAGAALLACGEADSDAAAAAAASPDAAAAAGSGVTQFPRGEQRPAPDFTFEAYQGAEVLGGDTVPFSQVMAAGKSVVLNFWAGQCPPCRIEIPDLERAYQETKDVTTIVGLDVGPFVGLGSRDDGRTLIRELGATYPLGTTPDAAVIQQYRVLGMPTTIFITPDAQIMRQWTGILDEAALLDLIADLNQASTT